MPPRREEISERLCKVDTQIFRPRIARHSSDPADLKLYNIVNLPDFVQRVEVRQCEHADGHNVGQGIGGTEHWCRQEYLAACVALKAPRGPYQARAAGRTAERARGNRH